MIKKYLKNTDNFLGINLDFFSIFSTGLFSILGLLYWLSKSLEVYDAPGHLNLIWYLNNYLWPDFSGWNPFSLLGFDQGVSYPPLFHYLAATLSFVTGVEVATKILILLAFLATPLSILYFAKSLSSDRGKQFAIAVFLTILFLILPGYFGADLKALTQVGLLTSFISLPLTLFYLGSLSKVNEGRITLPTALLSAILLTHFVAGLFALLFLLSFLIVSLLQRKPWKPIFFHILFAVLITSFFWAPFLLNYANLSVSAHLPSLGLPNLICLVISVLSLTFFFKKRESLLLTISLVATLLSLTTLGDSLVEKVFNSGFLFEKIYSLHLYRFQIYEYFLVGVLVSILIVEFLQLNFRFVKGLLALILALATLYLLLKSPFPTVNTVALKDSGNNGRFLETFSRAQALPTPYAVQTQLVEKSNLPWAYGLFTEATPNGPYLGSLIKSLNSDNYPQTKSGLVENQIVAKEKAESVLDLFAVANLLNLDKGTLVASAGKNFFLERRSPQNLVEIPKLRIEIVKDNWESQVQNWWGQQGALNSLLVFDPKNELSEMKPSLGQAEIVSHNQNWSAFTVKINSSSRVPALVKFGFSPNWHAFQGGKEVPIFKVSPALMLIKAQGEVNFRFSEPYYKLVLLLVSFVSLILLFKVKKL